MKYLLVAVMWIAFGFIHSLLISNWSSNWINRVTGRFFAFYRLGYNLFSFALFIWLLHITNALDKEVVIKFVPPWTLLQYSLLSTSALVIVWALLSYDALEFLGIRQITKFGEKKGLSDNNIITKKGLLGIVRHPMYLATIVFMWSLNSTKADIIAHLILTVYILVGIRIEENKLVEKYGSSYIEYQREVPALIPKLKK